MPERRRVRVDDRKQRVTPPLIAREAAEPAVAPPGESPDDAPAEAESVVCQCPRLDPADWHDVESDWSDITFLRTTCRAAFGVPVGFSDARDDLEREAASLGGTIPEDAMLLIGEGRFRRPLLLEVEGVDPGHDRVYAPGGVAYSRLVSAPIGVIKKEHAATVEAARRRFGRAPDDVWTWYITCRICSGERDFETLFAAHYREPV